MYIWLSLPLFSCLSICSFFLLVAFACFFFCFLILRGFWRKRFPRVSWLCCWTRQLNYNSRPWQPAVSKEAASASVTSGAFRKQVRKTIRVLRRLVQHADPRKHPDQSPPFEAEARPSLVSASGKLWPGGWQQPHPTLHAVLSGMLGAQVRKQVNLQLAQQ